MIAGNPITKEPWISLVDPATLRIEQRKCFIRFVDTETGQAINMAITTKAGVREMQKALNKCRQYVIRHQKKEKTPTPKDAGVADTKPDSPMEPGSKTIR